MNETCIAPETIQDWEIQAYLDGETLPGISEHLERCPFCAARASRLARIEEGLVAMLYRFDCPSPDELRAFVWRATPPVERQPVADHLAICPLCREEVETMAAALAAPGRPAFSGEGPEPMGLTQRLAIVWGRLLSLTPEPVPALRGAMQSLDYRAGSMDVSLTIEALAADQYVLLGQVLGAWSGSRGQVSLCGMDGVEMARAPLDETGSFALPGLLPGPWEVHLRWPAAGDAARGQPGEMDDKESGLEIVLVTVGLVAKEDGS